MESEKISQNPTVNKKLNSFWSIFGSILLIILFLFGSGLLIYQTFNVQNSCQPMIQVSKETKSRLAKDCNTDDSWISKGIKGSKQVWHFIGDKTTHLFDSK
jgi:hypothetical protein